MKKQGLAAAGSSTTVSSWLESALAKSSLATSAPSRTVTGPMKIFKWVIRWWATSQSWSGFSVK